MAGLDVPFSKPVMARDVDDMHDALFGSFRKPKERSTSPGQPFGYDQGGYTSSRGSWNDRGVLALLVGVPAALIAVLVLVSRLLIFPVPEPINSTCTPDGYTATYERGDFYSRYDEVTVHVKFNDKFVAWTRAINLPNDPNATIEVVLANEPNPRLSDRLWLFDERIETCEVVKVNYIPKY